MLEIFFEIALCVFAVYGGYTLLRDVKRILFRYLDKRNKDG